MEEADVAKISDKTVLSLHMVVILMGFAIWIIRLGDHVDENTKQLEHVLEVQKEGRAAREALDRRVIHLEEVFNAKRKGY